METTNEQNIAEFTKRASVFAKEEIKAESRIAAIKFATVCDAAAHGIIVRSVNEQGIARFSGGKNVEEILSAVYEELGKVAPSGIKGQVSKVMANVTERPTVDGLALCEEGITTAERIKRCGLWIDQYGSPTQSEPKKKSDDSLVKILGDCERRLAALGYSIDDFIDFVQAVDGNDVNDDE